MPTERTPGGGYRYGKHGKTYYGKDAKKKAQKQGQAIEISRHAGKKGATKPKVK